MPSSHVEGGVVFAVPPRHSNSIYKMRFTLDAIAFDLVVVVVVAVAAAVARSVAGPAAAATSATVVAVPRKHFVRI